MIRALMFGAALLIAPSAWAQTCVGSMQRNSNLSDVCSAPTAINNIVPSQGGNSGKFLTTNGSAVSWDTVTSVATAFSIRAVTGTTDTLLQSDLGKIVTYSNTTGITVTLPQAGSGGNFTSGWWVVVRNINTTTGSNGVLITPTTSTIDGKTALQLPMSGGEWTIWSDGTNYNTSQNISFTQQTSGGATASPNFVLPWTEKLGTVRSTAVGSGAVDLQTYRTDGTQVASGTNSFIVGERNTASATGAVAVGGLANTVSGPYAGSLGGQSHTLSSSYTAAVGGFQHTASGEGAVGAGSYAGTQTGVYGLATGKYPQDRGRGCGLTVGSGTQSGSVRSQGSFSYAIARWLSTTTTSELGCDYTANSFQMINYHSAYIHVSCTTIALSDQTSTGAWLLMTDIGGTKFPGALVTRGANAAATAIQGTVAFQTIGTTGNAGTDMTFALAADTTNGRIQVNATSSTMRNYLVSCNITGAESTAQ